jgi:mercuric ion transport protein
MNAHTFDAKIAQQSGNGMARIALAAGGFLAALGLASCCALPIALSMLGIGAASLVGIGFLAAPYQPELLAASLLCLAGVGFLSWRQWRARVTGACAIERTRMQAVVAWLSLSFFLASVGLVALTFWIEPPL